MRHKKRQHRQTPLRVKIIFALCIASLLYGTVAMALPGIGQQSANNSFHSDSVPKQYFYDASGNHVKTTSSEGEENKTYDVLGRLIRYEGPDGMEEYTYMGTGAKRHSVKKTPTGSTTTEQSHFLYDGDNAVTEYLEADYGPSKQYVTLGLDQHLSVTDLNGPQAKIYYYSQDGLNSVRTLTDPLGVLHSQHDYTAFGDPFDAIVASVQSYGYTGREHNPISKDINYRYRNYNPTTGRFDSRDPIGYNFNLYGDLYRYANTNPVMHTDPYGLMTLAELCNMKGHPNFLNMLRSFLAGGYTSDPDLMAVLNEIRRRKIDGEPNWLQEGIWDLQDFQKSACPNGIIDLPHQFRNVFQACPELEPKCDPDNWDPEGANYFHKPNQCYRGLGSHSGSQCCYSNGMLDDYSPAMGTWDYFAPGISIPLHLIYDIVTHTNEGHYAGGLTEVIPAAPYSGIKK